MRQGLRLNRTAAPYRFRSPLGAFAAYSMPLPTVAKLHMVAYRTIAKMPYPLQDGRVTLKTNLAEADFFKIVK